MNNLNSSSRKKDELLAFPYALLSLPRELRFGNDALLLAAFACHTIEKIWPFKDKAALRLVELGCGDGAAILGVLTKYPVMTALGLDRNPDLIKFARQNALTLAKDGASFVNTDIHDLKTIPFLDEWEQKADLVLANPPWRHAEDGRRSKTSARNIALWATPDSMAIFCKAACRLLKHRGQLCCIIDPASLPALFGEMDKRCLGIRELMPLHAHSGEAAIRVLVRGQKNAKSLPRLLSPLILHDAPSPDLQAHWSEEALTFCPWLKPQTE